MQLYPKLIMDALATVTYAGTKKNLVDSQMVADQPAINGNKVTVVLEFPRDTDPFLKSTVKAAEAAIKYHCGQDVEVEIQTEFKSKPRPEKVAWARALFLPIWPSPLLAWVTRLVCLIPISLVLPCPRCSTWRMPVLMLLR